MRRLPVLFLDDGGVMNDNAVRGRQWQRLVGEFFVPILGGDLEAWARANFATITALLEPSGWAARLRAAPDYPAFLRQYHVDWLASMCMTVGVAMPPEDEADALVERAERWIRPQVDAAFPGVVEALRALHASGYRLFTASGESSEDLDDYLRSMMVRECFEHLYGPDLIETFKDGPEFYTRAFAGAGVRAEEALVVDDNPMALRWAIEAGAATVLVRNGAGPSDGTLQIQSLAELPDLLTAVYG
jgi:HAD superfamily hydrolase (TIGR01509 family)